MILLKTNQYFPSPHLKKKVMHKLFLKFPHLGGWCPEARGGTSSEEPACQRRAAGPGVARVRRDLATEQFN